MITTKHRPFVIIVCLFGLGIFIQEWVGYFRVPFVLCVILVGMLLCLSIVFFRKTIACLIFLMISLMLLGIVYTHSYKTFLPNNIYYNAREYIGGPVSVAGIIDSSPRKKDTLNGSRVTFEVKVRQLKTQTGWVAQSGRVLVKWYQDRDVSYGDYVVLTGKLYRPYNFSFSRSFSYKKYLRRKGILFVLNVGKHGKVTVVEERKGNIVFQAAYDLRGRLAEVFNANLSSTESGVMQAVIVGDRTHLPDNIRKLFRQTGTAHVLAISGLHVGIVAGLFFLFFRLLPIPGKLQYLLTMLLLVGFVLLTGARPSVVRAAVMVIIFLIGFLIEREPDGVNSLALASFIILLFNPLSLFDIGFQLSFVSVFTIIMFFSVLPEQLRRGGVKTKSGVRHYILQSFVVSVSAWLGAAGLIAYYFKIITPVTLLANLIIVPLITVLVAIGVGLLFFAFVLPFVTFTFAACIKLILSLMIASIYFLEKIPGAHFPVKDISLIWVFIYYAFLSTILLIIRCFNKK